MLSARRRHRNARQRAVPASTTTGRTLERLFRIEKVRRYARPYKCDGCGRSAEDRSRWLRVLDEGGIVRHVCSRRCWLRVADRGNKRPRTRGECRDAQRPCPWVACKYHLYLDVLPDGGVKCNFPDLDVLELEPCCALDVADRGPHGVDELARLLNLTRERMRLVYLEALGKVVAHGGLDRFRGWLDEEGDEPWQPNRGAS